VAPLPAVQAGMQLLLTLCITCRHGAGPGSAVAKGRTAVSINCLLPVASSVVMKLSDRSDILS
jgi:hypothetical protein